jgi:hypothetical protein
MRVYGVSIPEHLALEEFLRISGALRAVAETRGPAAGWGHRGLNVQIKYQITSEHLQTIGLALARFTPFRFDLSNPFDSDADPVFGEGFLEFLDHPYLAEYLRRGTRPTS